MADIGPLCYCAGGAVNWSAVEAVGTVLAVIAAGLFPLWHSRVIRKAAEREANRVIFKLAGHIKREFDEATRGMKNAVDSASCLDTTFSEPINEMRDLLRRGYATLQSEKARDISQRLSTALAIAYPTIELSTKEAHGHKYRLADLAKVSPAFVNLLAEAAKLPK